MWGLARQIDLEPATSAKLPMPMTGLVLDNRHGNEWDIDVEAELVGKLRRCAGL